MGNFCFLRAFFSVFPKRSAMSKYGFYRSRALSRYFLLHPLRGPWGEGETLQEHRLALVLWGQSCGGDNNGDRVAGPC